MIYGVGMLDSGMTWDYAQAVMQNEMVSMIVKSIQGIPLSDELMALDEIYKEAETRAEKKAN